MKKKRGAMQIYDCKHEDGADSRPLPRRPPSPRPSPPRRGRMVRRALAWASRQWFRGSRRDLFGETMANVWSSAFTRSVTPFRLHRLKPNLCSSFFAKSPIFNSILVQNPTAMQLKPVTKWCLIYAMMKSPFCCKRGATFASSRRSSTAWIGLQAVRADWWGERPREPLRPFLSLVTRHLSLAMEHPREPAS